jgi:hypothetical protein
MQAMEEALTLLGNPLVRYEAATPEGLRIITQALFEAVFFATSTSRHRRQSRVRGIQRIAATSSKKGTRANGDCMDGRDTTPARFRGPWVSIRAKWCRVGGGVGTPTFPGSPDGARRKTAPKTDGHDDSTRKPVRNLPGGTHLRWRGCE